MSSRFLFAPLMIALATGVTVRPVPVGGRGYRPPAPPATPRRSTLGTTTLDDQAELARHDLQLRTSRSSATSAIIQLARGTSDLHFMDIAATVNPATVHFRSLTEPSRVSVARAELRVRPARAGEAAAQAIVGRDVTLVRTRRRRDGRATEEVKARLLSYNNAPVWQIGGEIVTGMHGRSASGFPSCRATCITADAHLDARQHRRHAPPRRSVVSRGQAVVERGLRADRRARRQSQPTSTAG